MSDEITIFVCTTDQNVKDAKDYLLAHDYLAANITVEQATTTISYDAKNGVLTLKGSVKTPGERKAAEQLAQRRSNPPGHRAAPPEFPRIALRRA